MEVTTITSSSSQPSSKSFLRKREKKPSVYSPSKVNKLVIFFCFPRLYVWCVRFSGSYPYEKYPSLKALQAAKSLPPASDWYNSLTEEHITPEAYQHAQRVWDFFDCATMEDYMRVYLICDVFVLCEIFETFREIVLENFGLCPTWFLGIPSLAFQVINSFN